MNVDVDVVWNERGRILLHLAQRGLGAAVQGDMLRLLEWPHGTVACVCGWRAQQYVHPDGALGRLVCPACGQPTALLFPAASV